MWGGTYGRRLTGVSGKGPWEDYDRAGSWAAILAIQQS